MSWYQKSKSLEPDMWALDPKPHRTSEDSPVVRTPYGQIRQRVDIGNISGKYTGVHFTDSIEFAASYANNKSSADDPPVIIEIDPTGFERLPDVDAAADNSLNDYISESWEKEWSGIVNDITMDTEQKAEEIRNGIQDDLQFGESYSDYTDSVVDYIQEMHRGIPAQVILRYLEGKTNEETIAIVADMAKNGAPPELSIEIARQFRVMSSVGPERVVAIYQIERFSDELSQGSFGNEMEIDEEDGFVRDEEGRVRDEEGRLIFDFEDFEYGWPDLEVIYKNPNLTNTKPVYHGTSYNRAKQAFPKLLP